MNTCCHKKQEERSLVERQKLYNRLSRIEGQVRGVRKMVDENVYCVDIVTQIAAINAALNAFSREILSNHIHTCLVDDIRQGKEEKLDELMDVVKRLMK